MSQKPQALSVNDSCYTLTHTGLVVAGESTLEQWEACGDGLRQIDEARQ